jgi:hypothetical protein
MARTYHTTIGLDRTGHSTWAWAASDSSWIIPLIKAKMDQGYEFWIVKQEPLREERLVNLSDLHQDRHVIMRDPVARELFEQGRISMVADADDDEGDLEVTGRARTAEEVVANDTLAHRPQRGG